MDDNIWRRINDEWRRRRRAGLPDDDIDVSRDAPRLQQALTDLHAAEMLRGEGRTEEAVTMYMGRVAGPAAVVMKAVADWYKTPDDESSRLALLTTIEIMIAHSEDDD